MFPLLLALLGCPSEPEAPVIPPDAPVHSPVAYATARAVVQVDGAAREVRAWPAAAGEQWTLHAEVEGQGTPTSEPAGPEGTAELVVGSPPLAVARLAVVDGATPRVEVEPTAATTVDVSDTPWHLVALPLLRPGAGWEIQVHAPEAVTLCGHGLTLEPGESAHFGVLVPGADEPVAGLRAEARPSRSPTLSWTEPPPCPTGTE